MNITETAQKISEFRQLRSGWHFGEGTALPEVTIGTALKINRAAGLRGYASTNAFPGINGEIQVTVYDGSIYLEFTIDAKSKITFVREDDDHEVAYEEDLSITDALAMIPLLTEHAWRLSDLSTPTPTLIAKSAASSALRSNRLVTGAEFQLLIKPVSTAPAYPSANILRDSTKNIRIHY